MIKEKKFITSKTDRVFKTIFLDEDNPSLLKEFLRRLLNKEIQDIKFLREELPVLSTEDKVKTVDMLVKIDNEYLHLELNCNDSSYYHVRNFIFFANIYSRKTKRKEEYDLKTKFIHIDLTYGMSKNKPLESHYYVQNEYGDKYVNNFEIIVYNMDKYMNFWYNEDEENIKKYKHLIMLDLQSEGLEEISKGDDFVKEFEKKIEDLNEQETYEPFVTYEEDQRMILNTEKHISYDEGVEAGMEAGIEVGIEEGSYNREREIAKNMLNKGMDKNTISEITGLSIEEINNLETDL